ncbi:membrane protein [hydrocarbon metagenome]|uniref:Membrane protein n=1 Tax=hydrocarbon metagenome TaxID=938273 RepID=A0A0W8G5R0_9ZZZZ
MSFSERSERFDTPADRFHFFTNPSARTVRHGIRGMAARRHHMLRDYQIVIFKDQHGVYRKLRLRGWLFFLTLLAIAGMVAANIVLLSYYGEYTLKELELAAAEKTVQEQKSQLLNLSEKIKGIEADLSRIRDFDAKLRLMINLDQEPRNVSPQPEGGDQDFSKKYIPLYRQEMLARNLHKFLHDLGEKASLEKTEQEKLLALFNENKDYLSSTPAIWPTQGWISSEFGERVSPFSGRKEFHKGLDISTTLGTPVYATAAGTVSFAGEGQGSGPTVTIEHRGGITTSYSHLDGVAVTQGQTVSRGEAIGSVGDSGRSTGPHLHYEVRVNGVPVNPMRYILN